MKKSILGLLSIAIAFVLTGCGSSMYTYNVEPTPIQKGQAKYVLNSFNLKLEHGEGRNPENHSFKNEDELKKSFETFINSELTQHFIRK